MSVKKKVTVPVGNSRHCPIRLFNGRGRSSVSFGKARQTPACVGVGYCAEGYTGGLQSAAQLSRVC